MAMNETIPITGLFPGVPSTSFQRAVEKFTQSLPVKRRREFAECSLDDVRQAIAHIQEKQGSQKKMRNMARIQAFLEAMEQYGKVVEVFLNSTPFLGYVWGPIRFILLVTNTWIDSLDTLLDAYEQIGERIPSLMQYQALFERNLEMRRALELYYCDILEFHHHALQFLSRPGINKDLLESEKGTVAVFEAQRVREMAEIHFREVTELEKRKQHAVLIEKLNPPNYQLDQYVASEQRLKSQSGEWIFKNVQFQGWADVDTNPNPLLYIHGIPGRGKTILASLIIEKLQEQKPGVVLFFYCKHDQPRNNTFTDILRALLAQMLCQDNALAPCFYEMCSTRDQAGILTIIEELALIAFDSQDTSFIILDGLDECKPGEAERVISWFSSRQKDKNPEDCGHIRLLCIGQRVDPLQRMLSSAEDIPLENASHQGDIERYVREEARKIREEFEISPRTEAEIVMRVKNAANCMFLFAKLVMENLSNQTSQYDLLKELEPNTFPVDLKDAYERVVSAVLKDGPQRAAAIRIIGWVACANRPLKWREIQATFFIDPKTSTCDYSGRRLRKGCKKLCGSLIDLQKLNSDPDTEAVLHLVHDTARDYLLQNGLINLSLQHAQMALFCTEYLLSAPFHLTMQEGLMDRVRAGYYALQDYAVSYWYDHISSTVSSPGCSADIHDRLAHLLKSLLEEYGIPNHVKASLNKTELVSLAEVFHCIPLDARSRNQWFNLELRTLRNRDLMETLGEGSGLSNISKNLMRDIYGELQYKCSKIWCTQFTAGFESRLARDEHLNRHNRPFRCTERDCPFGELGFEVDADLRRHVARNHISINNNQFEFPQPAKTNDNIFRASARGDVSAVKFFLDRGENVQATSRPRGRMTPLFLAAQNSHLPVCKILVESGADVNFKGPFGSLQSTALHAAVSNTDIEMVHYFLSLSNVLPDQSNRSGKSPLYIAVENNSEAVVKLLLETEKFNLDFKAKTNLTLLGRAAQLGAAGVVKLLLATGKVNPDARDATDSTPLGWAAANGNEEVVKLLLATGKVNPDAEDNTGLTPLCLAAGNGHEEVVKALLATGKVNPDAKDNTGLTPLCLAAAYGKEEIVRLLLATGKVDPDAKDSTGLTPLGWAARNGSSEVVKLLLATGKANPNAKDNSGKTPLHYACKEEIAQLLLATGMVTPLS